MDGQVSPAVEEANRRLYTMRAVLAAQRARSGGDSPGDKGVRSRGQAARGEEAVARLATGLIVGEPPHSDPVNWPLRNAQKELRQRRLGPLNRQNPNGMAVGACNEGTRAWLLLPLATGDAPPTPPRDGTPSCPATGDRRPAGAGKVSHPPAAVTVHPTMLHAILRQGREASARVWLLLRLADRVGRGWLTVDEARRELTAPGGPLFVCGWRRLRQLLAEGEGVFWVREARSGGDRLWLRGSPRVALALDCRRLQGYPIELPIAALLGGIQGVRAAFYAAFHAGREARPISRATLATLSGVGMRTQLAYDSVAHVARSRNIVIGERYSADNARERAWEHGRAVFRFVDRAAKEGRAGGEYVAWRLPNSYYAAYQRRSRGSRKRLNRKIDDLVMKGIPGNDERAVESVFHANGAQAARQFNRDPRRDAYWQRPVALRGGQLWGVIVGQRAGIASRPGFAGQKQSNRVRPEGRQPLEARRPTEGGTAPAEQTETPRPAAVLASMSPDITMPDRPQTGAGYKTATEVALPALSDVACRCTQ